jgi:DnaJ domain.
VTSKNEIAGLGPSTDRPRLNTTIDLTKQKLSPTEGFVLSRVDGRSSYDEICMVSGLGRDETLRILRDLKQARLILGPGEVAVASRKGTRAGHPPASEAAPDAWKSGSARAAEAAALGSQATTKPAATGAVSADKPRAKAAAPAGSRAGEKARRPPTGPLERLDDGSEVAAGDVVEWPDAPLELKARIVRLHRRLRKLSACDLLGVGKDADGATVKRAFATASKELHPDRYFGKNLGSFKARLVAIFSRLTEAVQEIEESRKGKG